MRWRALIVGIALLAMLVHATAATRNVIAAQFTSTTAQSTAAAHSLEADLRVICQGGASGSGKSDQTPAERDTDKSQHCPLCLGLADTVALFPTVAASILLPAASIALPAPPRDQRVDVQRHFRPPGRAPPAS